MKFFDYKFLILLGLSLVVYFIYREVEFIRSKVDKIEKELKNKSDNSITDKIDVNNILTDTQNLTNTINKPILSLPTNTHTHTYLQLPTPMHTPIHTPILENMKNEEITTPSIHHNSLNIVNDTNNVTKSPLKIISVDMSPSKINEQTNFNSGVKINTHINKSMLISDTDCSDSNSSKHLAIYSNDNEQYDETQNSLLESIESHKIELKFNYDDKVQIPNLHTNVDEIINLVTTPNDSENKKNNLELELHKIDSEKEKIDSEKEKSEKEKCDIFELDETKLEKKKLTEIKKIAESKNISLSKKINGNQRCKNKNELIKEILTNLH